MQPIIEVEHISKEYTLRHQRGRYVALRDILAQGLTHPLQLISGLLQKGRKTTTREPFFALKDVNFSIQAGEVVGIIGRNGAGKSTLLKILSRITPPTTGKITLRGRVGSLLEVGTGFHPELTGRENIFLNGAILGMSRSEIIKNFDSIVEFAGIERFLDTPVKHYSSGMYVRLAFSVAAHLEPDILIIDEVLAVGDVEFQKKCLGKMNEVTSQEGRTILLVSHNMAAIQSLCKRCIVLKQGQIVFDGDPTEAINIYLQQTAGHDSFVLDAREDRSGSGEIQITRLELRSQEQIIEQAVCGQDITFAFHFKKKPDYQNRHITVGIHVRTHLDAPVFLHHSRLTQTWFDHLPEQGAFAFHIKKLPLPPGTYHLYYSILDGHEYIDTLQESIQFRVESGDFYGTAEVPQMSHGVCLIEGEWGLFDH